MPGVLVKSNLHQKVASKLSSPYSVMTTFFFRRSVEKAFQIDDYPGGLSLSLSKRLEGNAPFIILAVDDVMYIVNAVAQKSISTAQRDVVSAVIPTVGRLLGDDFIGMIQRKMKDECYPKPVVQGGFPPEEKIIHFIVLINSLDMANEYLGRVVTGLVGSGGDEGSGATQRGPVKGSFPFEKDAEFVAGTLRSLETAYVRKSMELLNEGIQVLFIQVVKLRLRPVLSDTFRDADYTLTEEEVTELAQQNEEDEAQYLDQVPRRFGHGWDPLMKPIARLMTPRTFSSLLGMTTRYLANVLEKRVLGYGGRMGAFGAIRIERDLGAIVDMVSRGDYGVRESFSKVTQLLMVANMEEDEWDELNAAPEGDGGLDWVLSEEDRRRARKLVKKA